MGRTATRSRTSALPALLRALRGSVGAGGPGLGTRSRAVPRLVRSTLTGEYTGSTRRELAALAAGLLYVASPIDLVPEVLVPFLGLADDAVVVAWLAGRLLGDTEDYLAWERVRAQAADDVVPGQVVR